jgi:3',5'-cyclic AMP phosphodiesterase CpdA
MTLCYRILHLTDFHWDEERSEDQKLVIGRLLADLKKVLADRKVDAIVFSGDLVNKGGDASSFLKAKAALLDPVREALQLTDEAVLICPGNHDVDRPFALKQTYVEAGLLTTLTDSVSLNAHFDKYINVPFDQDDSNQRLTGVVSDRDLRRRCGSTCRLAPEKCASQAPN